MSRSRRAGVHRSKLGPEGEVTSHTLLELACPAGITHRSALGEDLDHAGGGFRPVEGGGRRALDHFDPLDVLRVDGVQRATHVVVAPARIPNGRNVFRKALTPHPNAVHVDERLVRLGHGDVAPEPDHGAATGGGGTLGHRHAGNTALKHGVHVGGRLHDVLGHVQLGDGVSDLPSPCGPGRPRHHDLVETERLGLKGEVLLDGSSRRNGDFHFGSGVSDPLGPQGVGPRRHVQDDKSAVVPGQRPEAGIGQVDLHGSQRPLSSSVRHLARDRAVLGAKPDRYGQRGGQSQGRRPAP